MAPRSTASSLPGGLSHAASTATSSPSETKLPARKPTKRPPPSQTSKRPQGILSKGSLTATNSSRRNNNHNDNHNRRRSRRPLEEPSEGPSHSEASETTASYSQAGMVGMGGISPSSLGGMYGSPYYGAAIPPMMPMMGGPFSSLYQWLYTTQNFVFSVGQAVQILGTNQQALQQALDSLTTMADHAIAVFGELRALEAITNAQETDQQKKRRRRLQAIRWALVMGSTWLVYKILRRLTTSSRRRNRLLRSHGEPSGNWPTPSNPYASYGPSYGSSYGRTYQSPYLSSANPYYLAAGSMSATPPTAYF